MEWGKMVKTKMKSFLAFKPNNDFLSILELTLIIFFVFGVCYWGYRFAPGSVAWDDLLYIHTAYNLEAVPRILNRYFTIFLLNIFISLCGGDPILGAQYYGTFIFSTIVVLVYLNAKTLAKRNHFFYGLLSVLFLLSTPIFIEDFGAVVADYSVTSVMLLGILFFNLYGKNEAKQEILLFLFGIVLVLATKTKETGALLIFLIPGMVLDDYKQNSVKSGISKLIMIGIGVITGILIVILLNSYFLHDPMFGFRISDIKELLNFNNSIYSNRHRFTSVNYLSSIASFNVFIISLLLIINNPINHKTKWLWLMVLGIIMFLTISAINGGWGVVNRYLTPSIAVLSIMAPQIIKLEYFQSPQQTDIQSMGLNKILFWVSSVILIFLYIFIALPKGWRIKHGTVGLITPIAFSFLIVWALFVKKNKLLYVFGLILLNTTLLSIIFYFIIAKPLGWSVIDTPTELITPLLLVVTVFWVLFIKNDTYIYSLGLLFLISMLVIPTAVTNIYNMVLNKPDPLSRFMPFSEFRNDVTCTSKSVLVSGTIFRDKNTLSRDVQSSRWMYNLYFRCDMDKKQFYYSASQEELLNYLSKEDIEYIFLESDDYKYLRKGPDTDQFLERFDIILSENQEYLVLIHDH